MENTTNASISFYVAGCMEFKSSRECHEGLTLEQAVECYPKVRKRNLGFGSGIGFVLKNPEHEIFDMVDLPIYEYDSIVEETIALVPYVQNHPLVVSAVEDLKRLESRLSSQNESHLKTKNHKDLGR